MNHLQKFRRALLAATMLCQAALFAPAACFADAASPAKKITSIEGITEYRLDNGLRILLFPDQSTPRVTVNLTVLVGSRHEGYGETGMAHLLEHMVFKGTPKHRDIPKALRDHGAQFNGTTWYDRTNYFETMDGTNENLEFAIRLEADRLVNSFIKREDLASEMTVVRNEFEQGENNPERILSQRMLAVAYEWHNYGKETIGNRSDIERVPIDSLQAFYRTHYQPDNVVLIVAGKFEPAKALGFIAEYFGPLKKPARKLAETYTEEPPQDGERSVVLRRVGSVSAVGAVYHIPAAAHADFAAVEVLEQCLVPEPSGRLYKALVAAKLASSVRAGGYPPMHDPGVFEVITQVAKGQPLEQVRVAMLGVLEKLATDKLTTEEVERAKTKLLKDRKLRLTKSNTIGTELSEWAAAGDWRLLFLHRDRVAKVTPDDVNRVAAKYFIRNNRTVGLYIPSDQAERAKIPETPDVADLLKYYKGGQAIAAGEAVDPTPENIENRVKRSAFPSGLKVALLPKKSRGETVVLQLSLRYGNEESLNGLTEAADFLPTLMLRGTKKHTRQELQDELDKLTARLTSSGQPGLLTFNVECKRDTLPAVLRLLGEVLREPTFPEQEFEVLKRQRLERLRKGSTEPIMLAQIAIQRKLNPYPKTDIRYVPTVAESIERVEATTLEQVRKLYTQQLGAQHGEFVAVGDFDPDETVKLVEGLLKGWTTETTYRRIARPAKTNGDGGREVVETPDKANAVYVAGHALALMDTDADHPALQVANFILGSAPLASRLSNRVRGKEGLSYGVGSQYFASPIDKAGGFVFFAICNPVNMAKVNKAIAEEVDKLLKDGVTDKEVSEAKKAYLKRLKGQRSSDAQQASLLGNGLFLGRTLAYEAEQEKKIAALTPDAVNAAIRKHLIPRKLAIVEAGDFKKKEK
jgi:zinc protease